MFNKADVRKIVTWTVALALGLHSCSLPPKTLTTVEPERLNIYYIHDNQLISQSLGQQLEVLLTLPDLGQIKDTLQVRENIFVLRERGLQKVSLADKTVELIEEFSNITVNGALFASTEQELLIYAVDNKVNVYHLGSSTTSEVLSQPGFFVPLGLSADGMQLYLVPRGGDAEFPDVWILTLYNSKIKQFPIGIGTDAILSPNSRYLAIVSTHYLALDKPLEYRLTLFDLTSPESPGQILSLPNPPSHSHGKLIWSPNSQELYFLLRPGAPYDNPATSHGLWRLAVGSGIFSRIANIDNPTLHLISLSPDANWAILLPETESDITLVHIISGEIQTIELPTGQIAIVRHQVISIP